LGRDEGLLIDLIRQKAHVLLRYLSQEARLVNLEKAIRIEYNPIHSATTIERPSLHINPPVSP